MPLYDFRCNQCGRPLTVRASFKEKDAGLQPECPVCQAMETEPVLAVGVFIGQGAGSDGRSLPLPMMSGPTCGCDSGGCGCG